MNIFKILLLLLISISSVINQCSMPVKTGNWSILTPLILEGSLRRFETNVSTLNNLYVENDKCLSITDKFEADSIIESIMHKLLPSRVGINLAVGDEPRWFFSESFENGLPRNESYFRGICVDDARFLITAATYTHGHYFDRFTDRYYYWDNSLGFLSTFYKAEAEESVLIGSTTEFVTFKFWNGDNFSLKLVESKNEIWTTNVPFLFVSNCSKSCFQDYRRFDFLWTISKQVQPLPPSCKTVINSENVDNITIIVVPVSILILVIITVATLIGCAYVFKKKYSKKQKQYSRNTSIVYKKRENQNSESGYEEAVEIHEYAEAGNANRIFYDQQGNRVNQILESEEQLEYAYAYSTFKPLKSLGTKENSGDVNYDEISLIN